MAKRKGAFSKCMQGTYDVVNKEKYVGTKNPRYLSSYEYAVFRWADNHPSVIRWGSETTVVPYMDPRIQRKRRYMVDIFMEVRTKNGEFKTYLAEVKPHSQTLPPVKTSRKRQDVYLKECEVFTTNMLKWDAAKKFCKERGWEFIVLTEFQIFKK